MVRRGDKITVRDLAEPPDVWRARVRLVVGGRITWEIGNVVGTCACASEGRVWAKDWHTKAARALRTVTMLESK